jgi:type IV pilus assembly protein PilA
MSNRKGFTLIELLIVVVIIGILAAIAIPKFANTKEKAVVASMKSDLRNLVTAQEAFFSDNQDYASGTYKGDGTPYTQTNGTGGAGTLAFTPSANNVVVIAYVDAAGWSATATNPAVTGTPNTCGRIARTTRQARQGFTLIELLIVVVIIGLLAAIAIPRFANTKERAVVASMKSDLRNLASAQESYWVENRTYYNGAVPSGALPFQVSPGVLVTIINGTDAGWSAKATAVPLTNTTCVIFYGSVPPIPPATADAAVACS